LDERTACARRVVNARSAARAGRDRALPIDSREVVVHGGTPELIGTTSTASEGIVVNDETGTDPGLPPRSAARTVPGLQVTSHSGEGKANQYLMRGYNLDHGTDLAVSIDGMPVNNPTHAHGQGYTDLNFMIPELATNIKYTKGTYYASQGDFASVGSIQPELSRSHRRSGESQRRKLRLPARVQLREPLPQPAENVSGRPGVAALRRSGVYCPTGSAQVRRSRCVTRRIGDQPRDGAPLTASPV